MHGGTRQRITCSSALALATLVALLAPSSVSANIGGSNQGGAGCGGGPCHQNVTAGLSVTVSGSATVAPNSTNTYTLTFGGETLSGGGFSLETDAGTLSVVDGNTQMTGAMITHLDGALAAPAGNIGDWSYTFAFTAPASVGTTITLDFSGVDFNANGNRTGDDWNVGTFTIVTTTPEPGTALLLGMGLGMLGFAGRRRTR
jgi:hypothetical protein